MFLYLDVVPESEDVFADGDGGLLVSGKDSFLVLLCCREDVDSALALEEADILLGLRISSCQISQQAALCTLDELQCPGPISDPNLCCSLQTVTDYDLCAPNQAEAERKASFSVEPCMATSFEDKFVF